MKFSLKKLLVLPIVIAVWSMIFKVFDDAFSNRPGAEYVAIWCATAITMYMCFAVNFLVDVVKLLYRRF